MIQKTPKLFSPLTFPKKQQQQKHNDDMKKSKQTKTKSITKPFDLQQKI